MTSAPTTKPDEKDTELDKVLGQMFPDEEIARLTKANFYGGLSDEEYNRRVKERIENRLRFFSDEAAMKALRRMNKAKTPP